MPASDPDRDELTRRIARYRTLLVTVDDPKTRQAIMESIAELEDRMRAARPEADP
jgi:hypothetical protein